MLVMYRPNLCENLLYPFVRFGNSGGDIPAPILNVLTTILMATSQPVIIAGTKEFDASWLDIAANGIPKFDHYRSTYLALDVRPLSATSARFVHQTIKGVPYAGQGRNDIGSVRITAYTRVVDRKMLYEIVGRVVHPLNAPLNRLIILTRYSLAANEFAELRKAEH
jgi:hypothetical protein